MELNTLASGASLTLLWLNRFDRESTLAVARKIENLSIFALTANTNAATLLAQCLEFNPRLRSLGGFSGGRSARESAPRSGV